MARFDDWMNPIAVKELRQAVRGKFVMVVLILSLLAELIAVATITVVSTLGNSRSGAAGPDTFVLLFSVVFTAAIFFIPMYGGFRMAAERSDANVDLLFITTIRPRTIVIGKVMAITGLVALLFSASLPFLMFSYVLRGVDFISIAVLIALAMLLVISQSIAALFIGSLPASRPFKILLAVAFFLGTFSVLVPMLTFTAEILRVGGSSMFVASGPFWTAALSTVASIVGTDAILLVLVTAIITPPAANRALPIRVMLTIVWLVSGAAAAWTFVSMRSHAFLQAWAVVQIGLITMVLLSATSERETWGPRVARTIPENPLLRALAFLFYSGAAGGTLWALLMYAATIGAFQAALVTSPFRVSTRAVLTQYLVDAALVMFGYAMTAVFLRRKVIRRVPAGRTWGLVLALFIVLTLLPPLAIITGDAESAAWERRVHITTMFNPFPTAQRSEGLRDQRTLILGIWALVAMAANAPWFLEQLRTFRRHTPPSRADVVVPELATE